MGSGLTKITVNLPPGEYRLSPAVRLRQPPEPQLDLAPIVAEHFDLDEACEAARQRIAEFINRSAAQHMRAWRERWQPQRLPPEELRAQLSELQRILRD